MKYPVILVLIICLAACQTIDSMKAHSVCEVTENPGKFRDADAIYIKGIVTDAYDLFLVKYFILTDKNKDCSVAIQSDKINPEIGREIVIRGVITNSVNYEDQSFLLIKEISD